MITSQVTVPRAGSNSQPHRLNSKSKLQNISQVSKRVKKEENEYRDESPASSSKMCHCRLILVRRKSPYALYKNDIN